MADFREYSDLVGSPNDLKQNEDACGFLFAFDWSRTPRLATPEYSIEPFEDYADRKQCFDSCLVEDGSRRTLYPPIVEQVAESGVAIPRTRRPADLYCPAASHKLVSHGALDAKSLRQTETTFLLQFVAFLYDCRLQFCDWQLDTRMVVRPQEASFRVWPNVAGALISKAIRRYRLLDVKKKLALTNILYVHSRARHLFWDWEQFTQECWVVDAVRGFLNHRRQRKPWTDTFDELRVHRNDQLVDGFRDLRNELFHESLWDGNMPGFSCPKLPTQYLRALNERLIAGLLDIGSSFRRSAWDDRQLNELKDD
jgi:hypothetical protein